MKMDFWEKTNYTDGVPETYTKQLREKKMCDFWVYMPFKSFSHGIEVGKVKYFFGNFTPQLRKKLQLFI